MKAILPQAGVQLSFADITGLATTPINWADGSNILKLTFNQSPRRIVRCSIARIMDKDVVARWNCFVVAKVV